MPSLRVLLLGGALLLAAATSRAGEIAVSLEGGYFNMTMARKSAEAVFSGSAGGATFGAQARLGLGRSFYVSLGSRWFQKEGERVFVADASGDPFRLGHPLTVRCIPVYALAGYRFSVGRSLVPYAGLGVGVTSYRETSTVAEIAEPDLSVTKASGHLVAGLEWGRGRFRFGAEAMFSTVPGVLGEAGVSKVYGESNAGGLTLVGKIVFVP